MQGKSEQHRVSRWAVVSLALVCGSWAYRTTVNVLHWRQTATGDARAVLGTPSVAEQRRVDAAVILYNDATLTIEALRAAANDNGPLGVEARNFLAHLVKQATR